MNPTQSDFIYRADNVVLPNTFKNDTKFANGMYVLASTKGRAAGAVLPANLKINNFYGLKEPDTPVYYDLSSVKPSDLNVPSSSIETDSLYKAYTSMFQVRKSDKSLILKQSEASTLGQITLYDPNNGSPLLEGGTITQPIQAENVYPKTGAIDFYVSKSAFPSNLTGYVANYEVLSAELSENAVIAKSGITSGEHPNLKTAYSLRTSNIIGDNPYSALKFNHSGGFVDNKITFQIWVYSEIAVDDFSLINRRTEYTVTIHLSDTELNASLTQLTFDGTSVTVPSISSNKYTITSHTLKTDGTMVATFTNPNTQLPIGHEMIVYGLYRSGSLVSSDYVQITIQPKATNNQLGFTMTVSDDLVNGAYEVRFGFYNVSAVLAIAFNKASSTNKTILNVSYSTFSSDANGSLEFTPVNSNFTTFIEFGYIMEGVLRDTTSVLTVVPSVFDPERASYLNQVESHDLKLNGETLLFVELSPFAYIGNATIKYTYITGGIKQYIVQYNLYNEAGTPTTITHTIQERTPEAVVVYKNGNQQFARPVPIAREEITTTLRLDFNFLYSSMYTDLTTLVNGSATLPNGMEITNVDNFLINTNTNLNTGTYTLSFALQRETDVVYNFPTLGIIKNLGVSAYLSNIKFQVNSDIVTKYPSIYEITSNGTEVVGSLYDIRAFFGGIDYNNADTNQIRYFRIDGEVTDLELSYYHPEFTLPLGAVIQRQVSPGVWSNDIYGDFTSDIEDEVVVVRYRILSETTFNAHPTNLGDISDSTIVYYDLTVFDNLYNLTLRFSLFYRFTNGTIVPASDASSPIKSSVILINVRNYNNLAGNFNEPTTIDPVTGREVYPYEGSIVTYTPVVNTQSTLFYYPLPGNITKYIYSFGKNESGVYNFTVVTPKYVGTTSGNLVNGLRYDYNIYVRTGATGGVGYPWNLDKYKLPVFDNTGKIIGKYYYVLTDRQIIREFAIVIEERTIGNQWGLYDDYTSWDTPNP